MDKGEIPSKWWNASTCMNNKIEINYNIIKNQLQRKDCVMVH